MSRLRREGKEVPGYLLRPEDPGHVPPCEALMSVTETLRAISPESPTLELIKVDPWGGAHSAYPPSHPKHQPYHALVLSVTREVEIATGVAMPAVLDSRVEQVFGRSASKIPAVKESVIRHLQNRIAELEEENTELRRNHNTVTNLEEEHTHQRMSPFSRHDSCTDGDV